MSNALLLLAKVGILKIPPSAWDAIFPHGPVISQHLVEYMAAGVVRDIAGQIKDKSVKAQLLSVGKDMAGFASQGLVQGWEDGDDICPPWPPFPFPWPGKRGPEPDPWVTGAVEQIVLADLLLGLAGVTVNPEISLQLREAATGLAKQASQQLMANFEEADVEPRSLRAC